MSGNMKTVAIVACAILGAGGVAVGIAIYMDKKKKEENAAAVKKVAMATQRRPTGLPVWNAATGLWDDETTEYNQYVSQDRRTPRVGLADRGL